MIVTVIDHSCGFPVLSQTTESAVKELLVSHHCSVSKRVLNEYRFRVSVVVAQSCGSVYVTLTTFRKV